MSHRLLPVPEEGVRGPHFSHHQVIEPQYLYLALVHQPPVHPCLSKEDIHGVLLRQGQGSVQETAWKDGESSSDAKCSD